jgi:cytochrome c556
MRWSVFIGLQCLILLAIGGVVYIHQDRVVALKKPPASLAQWYKPENKRQVWLHTMFKLRREMLAVDIYAKSEDSKNLAKWAGKLATDYRKIGEMVPEWLNKLDLPTSDEIQNAVQENRFSDVVQGLKDLDKNCQSCHTDFRTVTATLYRAPDFAEMKIGGSVSMKSHMGALSKQVNRVMIAFIDGRNDAALSTYQSLKNEMNQLGGTCVSCHKKGSQTYPTEKISTAMTTLEQSLMTGSLKDKGRALGTLAVLACAECHGTHRLSYDMKTLLREQKNWRELLKH